MKRIYLLLAVMIGFVTLSSAQNNAKAILDNVSNKLKTYKGITADFAYSTKDKKNVTRGKVNGKVFIKGQKYFVKQGGNEIYSDGAKTWNFNGDNEVTVAAVDDDSKMLSPQKLLSNFYDKDFTYTLVSSAGAYHEIQLIPVDKRKNFKQVNIFIDKTKNLVTKARVLDKSDNTIEFALTNVNTGATIPDSKFVFDTKAHPGVEVINQ